MGLNEFVSVLNINMIIFCTYELIIYALKSLEKV